MAETPIETGNGVLGLLERNILPGISKVSIIPGEPGAESNI